MNPGYDASNKMFLWIHDAIKCCVVYTAAKLNVIDHIYETPMTAEQLAVVTETHPGNMYRLLRALVSLEIVTENDQKQFSPTNFGLTLKSGEKGSVKNIALTILGPPFYSASGNLLYSVKTGKTAFDHVYGMSYFDYLNVNSEEATVFYESFKEVNYDKLSSCYDYNQFHHIIDVGGGRGHLLIEILKKTSNVRGTVFDLDFVAEAANKTIAESGVHDRCEFISGNFFSEVVGGGDCYILSYILHDWNDEKSVEILRNVRKQMKSGSKLLVIEVLLSDGNEPDLCAMYDIRMMTVFSGKERSRKEFEELFAKANLTLTAVVDAEAFYRKIIEAQPMQLKDE